MFEFYFNEHAIFEDFIVAECVFGDSCDYRFTLSVDRDVDNPYKICYSLSVDGGSVYPQHNDNCIVLRGYSFIPDGRDTICFDDMWNVFNDMKHRVDKNILMFLTQSDDGFKLPFRDEFCDEDGFMDAYYCIYDNDDGYGDMYRDVCIYKVCWPDTFDMTSKIIRCRLA